jgi:outer membrane protein assembly factor BamB
MTEPRTRPRRPPRKRRSKLPLFVLLALVAVALVGVLTHNSNSKAAARQRALLAAQRARRRARIANTPVTSPGPLPGALLIADRGNDRILLVDPNRKQLWRFPTAADRAKGRQLVYDDDTFVQPGGKALVTNEEDHGDILSIDIATHRVTPLFGVPGPQAGPGGNAGPPNHLNWPDDAYVLPDGTLAVADAYRCRILFIRNHRIVRQIGETDVCVHNPPRTLGYVNGDTPLPDGGVLVSEINGSWIDNFSKTGKLRAAFQAPVSYPSDPQPLSGGRILLADYASPGAVVILDRRGNVLWRYGPPSGWGALNHPSLAIMLPNGDIAINDDYNDRVVIVDPKRRRIVWQYGHLAQPGRGGGFLRTPDGMDFVPLGPHEKPLWQLVHHP